jgi:hypothetical protein
VSATSELNRVGTQVGHASKEELRDLEDVLSTVRTWTGISEPTPGIFYLRRKAFLHFHTKDGARWADAKFGKSWGSEIPLPMNCGQRAKERFLREIRVRYEACSENRSGAAGRRSS